MAEDYAKDLLVKAKNYEHVGQLSFLCRLPQSRITNIFAMSLLGLKYKL